MSHLNEFETEFTNQEALIRALCRVGFTRDQIEVHVKAQAIIGYHGAEDNKVGHIIIRKRHARMPSDLGWEKKGEVYVGHIDNFDYSRESWIDNGYGPGRATVYNSAWNVNLLNYYNMETSKMSLEARGIAYTECKDARGRLQLRAKFKVTTANQSRIKTHS